MKREEKKRGQGKSVSAKEWKEKEIWTQRQKNEGVSGRKEKDKLNKKDLEEGRIELEGERRKRKK